MNYMPIKCVYFFSWGKITSPWDVMLCPYHVSVLHKLLVSVMDLVLHRIMRVVLRLNEPDIESTA